MAQGTVKWFNTQKGYGLSIQTRKVVTCSFISLPYKIQALMV